MSTRLASPIAALAVVVIALACDGVAGSESGSASSPRRTSKVDTKPSVDVCSLLTAEDIAAVSGAKISDVEQHRLDTAICNFMVPGELFPVVSLWLYRSMPDVASSAELAQWRTKKVKEGIQMGDLKPVIEPIEGLGAPAIRSQIEELVTLEIAAKGRLLDVTTTSLDRSKSMAAKAISRLP